MIKTLQVTVFNDRAELRREFTVELVEGPNEVAIQASISSLLLSQHSWNSPMRT